HEQARVDRPDAGEHVLEEPDVTWHVDEREVAAGWQRRPGEPQVDGETASLLLRQPVGVDARQRQHEGRLAVIDVTGSAYDVHDSSALATTGSSDASTVRRSQTVRPSRTRAITGGSWARSVAV